MLMDVYKKRGDEINKLLWQSRKRLKALEQEKQSKQSSTLIINIMGRDGSLFRRIKSELPKGWNK